MISKKMLAIAGAIILFIFVMRGPVKATKVSGNVDDTQPFFINGVEQS